MATSTRRARPNASRRPANRLRFSQTRSGAPLKKHCLRMSGGATAISRDLTAEVKADIKDAGLAQQMEDAVRSVEDADAPPGKIAVKPLARIKKTFADINAGIVARFHKVWTSGAAVAAFKKKYASDEVDPFFRDEKTDTNARLKAIFSGKVGDVIPKFDRMSYEIVMLMAAQDADMDDVLAKLKADNAPNSLCVLKFESHIRETYRAYRRMIDKLADKRSEIISEIYARRLSPDDPAELLYETSALETFLWIFSGFSLIVLNSLMEKTIAKLLKNHGGYKSGPVNAAITGLLSSYLIASPIYTFT